MENTASTSSYDFARAATTPGQGMDLDKIRRQEYRPLVLVVDDDVDSVELIKATLRQAGINVIGASDGYMAIKKMANQKPDAILLDLMMPSMDGWETFRRVRRLSKVPVIFVTALASTENIVDGLNTGVDDYVTKPFRPAELTARVRAVLRRSNGNAQPKMYAFPRAELTIEPETHHVTLRGSAVDLSPNEFALLATLAEHAPRPATYNQISDAIWPDSEEDQRDRIKYLVHQLRQKLEAEPADPQLIQTKTNVGYQLLADDESNPGRELRQELTNEREKKESNND
ncbi:MAG: response regulator transcription factor [Anaerolineales bacterium]